LTIIHFVIKIMDLRTLQQEPIPPLIKDNGDPVFRDSWEAEAFALGNLLLKQGFFSCSEWVEIFSQEIKAAQAQGDPDRGDTYFSHWCSALERICVERGLTDWEAYHSRLELWHQAVLNTPHGVPLVLDNAYRQAEDDHGQDHHHHSPHREHLPANMLKPVAVVTFS
jgi:nitrile hydratase accessory protein